MLPLPVGEKKVHLTPKSKELNQDLMIDEWIGVYIFHSDSFVGRSE